MSDTDPAISELESGKLIQQLEQNNKDIRELTLMVRDIHAAIYNVNGIIVRVDRLEQRFIFVGFIIIPAISATVSWIVNHIFK